MAKKTTAIERVKVGPYFSKSGKAIVEHDREKPVRFGKAGYESCGVCAAPKKKGK